MHSENDDKAPTPEQERGMGTVAVLLQLFAEPELPAHSRAAALVCLSGPDTGRTFPLAEPSAELGRGPEAGIRLRDLAVSRRHARLLCHEHSWQVEDLGTPNGVWLNGRRLEATTPLAPGDMLQVGRSLLRFQPPVQEPPPPTPDQPEPPPTASPEPPLPEQADPAPPAEPQELPPAPPTPPHRPRWELWLIGLGVATALIGLLVLQALTR